MPSNPVVPSTASNDGTSLSSPLFGTRANPLSVDLSAPQQGTGTNSSRTTDASQNPDGTSADQTNKRPDGSTSDRANGSTDAEKTLRVQGQGEAARCAETNGESQSVADQSRVSGAYRTLLQRLEAAQAAEREKAGTGSKEGKAVPKETTDQNGQTGQQGRGQEGKPGEAREPRAGGCADAVRAGFAGERGAVDGCGAAGVSAAGEYYVAVAAGEHADKHIAVG